MRLALSMVKAWEELPEEMRCCPGIREFVDKRRSEPPVVIDLDDTKDQDILACMFCGAPWNECTVVMVVDSSSDIRKVGLSPMSVFHIDEGPYTGTVAR